MKMFKGQVAIMLTLSNGCHTVHWKTSLFMKKSATWIFPIDDKFISESDANADDPPSPLYDVANVLYKDSNSMKWVTELMHLDVSVPDTPDECIFEDFVGAKCRDREDLPVICGQALASFAPCWTKSYCTNENFKRFLTTKRKDSSKVLVWLQRYFTLFLSFWTIFVVVNSLCNYESL